MRTKLRSKVTLLFMALGLLLALPAIALADTLNISNDLTIGGNATKAPGDTGTANVWLLETNGTPTGDTNGCNASTNVGQEVTVTLSSNNTGVTFPNGNSVKLTDCGTANAKSISYAVANNATGTATISGTATGGKDNGTRLYNTDDTMTITITAPADTSAPTVLSINRSATSEFTNASSVSWTVTFSESVNNVDAADFDLANSGLTSPGPVSVSGSGATRTVSASTGTGNGTLGLNLVDNDTITDGAGNELGGDGTTGTGNGSFTGQVYTVDKTKPLITASATTLPDGNDYTAGTWTNKSVEVSFTCTDSGGSGINTNTVAGATKTASGENQSVTNTGTCTDKAGNTADSVAFSDIDIDKDAPTDVVGTLNRPADSNGWYNAPINATFDGQDALSGIASCSSDGAYSGPDGTGKTVTGSCTDRAGNSASGSSPTFKYDATAPDVQALADRLADHNGWYNAPVTVSFSGDDATSGNVSCDSAVIYGDNASETDGTNRSVSGSCTDEAGNSDQAAFIFDYDNTNPNVSGALARVADHNGWYNAPVGYQFSGTDATSGIDASSCTSGTYNGPDGTGLTVGGSCSDNAGNSANGSTPAFDYDNTNPTGVSGVLARAADHNGWYNAPVGYSFSGQDATSDIASCSSGTYNGPDGTGLAILGTCTDNAGNQSAQVATSAFKYDNTDPTLAPEVSPNPVQLNGDATVTAHESDNLSGVVSVLCGNVDASSVTLNGVPRSVSCTATDDAGNSKTASASYTVVFGSGFRSIFQPINGGNTPVINGVPTPENNYGDDTSRFKLGSTIPVKFELRDADGVLVGGNQVARLAVNQFDSKPDAGVDEALSTAASTTGNWFRYDSLSGQHIFNLSTKSGYTTPDPLNPGQTKTVQFSQGTWTLWILLEDGSTRSVKIQLVR